MRTRPLAFAAIALLACDAAPPDDGAPGSSGQPANMPSGTMTAVPPSVPSPSGLPPAGGPDEGIIMEDPSAQGTAAPQTPIECAGVAEEATEVLLPVDVIIVIDNSSSMSEEINEVQARINGDFAQIMESSGLDYRVIMVARYGDVDISVGGSDHPVCIGAPLGGTACTDPENESLVNNPPVFYHYSSDVGSREPWCDLLEGFLSPDELGAGGDDRATSWTALFPSGYSEALREDAFKHFLVITDDNSECEVDVDAPAQVDAGVPGGGSYDFDDADQVDQGLTAAEEFDDALLALSPSMFGTASERKYRWHSIVGMAEKSTPDGGVPEPWFPDEPITTDRCDQQASEGAGTGFQQLSVMTGGLRYPSCRTENFNAVFNAIAEGIVEGAMLSCEWDIPEAPDGQRFEREMVNVEFTAGDGIAATVPKADSLEACAGMPGWYFDNEEMPTAIRACPASCDQFQADMMGQVSIVFGCKTVKKEAT